MRNFLAVIAAAGLAIGVSTAAQANIVYNINQSSTTPEVAGENSPLWDSILGTVTTDGTIGVIQSSNILDWDLHLNDNINPGLSSELTPANSGIWFDTGNALSASATALSFDFSIPGAVFIIQNTNPHGFSSGYQYWCFQSDSGPCLTGETIVPNYYWVDGVTATGFSGPVPLSGTPEPATWAMMLIGVGGLGGALRTRRRLAVATA